MNCQDYQRWIEDAALGGIAGGIADVIDGPRRAQLDAHLAACPECRRAFEAAQKVYADIDQGIAARVEGLPSGEFAARVRMRLDALGARASCPPSPERAGRPRLSLERPRWPRSQAPCSPAWWRRSIWIPALAGAALALLLLGVWIARWPNGHGLQPPKQQAAQTVSPSPERLGARAQRPGARGQGSAEARGQKPRPRSSHSHRQQSAPDSGAPQLQVQIQPGQWAAVTSLYRAGQSGKVNETGQDVPADQPLQVQPMEVPPIVVAEIQDPKPVGSEPESTNIQDR